jgi:hypothetical protein
VGRMREATGPINIPLLHRVSKFTFFAVLFSVQPQQQYGGFCKFFLVSSIFFSVLGSF